jgi:hypothetical protein
MDEAKKDADHNNEKMVTCSSGGRQICQAPNMASPEQGKSADARPSPADAGRASTPTCARARAQHEGCTTVGAASSTPGTLQRNFSRYAVAPQEKLLTPRALSQTRQSKPRVRKQRIALLD